MRRFRTFVEAKKRGGIPADCVEVEYIDTTGGSWIDTGLPLASPFSCSGDVMALEASACWIGEFYQNRRMYILYPTTGTTKYFGYGYYTGNATGTVPVTYSRIHFDCVLKSGEQSLKIDGVYSYQKNLVGDVNNGNTLWLGKVQWTTVIYPRLRIYNFKATSGAKSIDLVPVRRVEGGVSVGYMCDKLTGQLYGNAGTGSFVIGPDVVPSRVGDYVQEGLVAMWDGIENAGFGLHDGAATVWQELVSGAASAAFDPAFKWTDKGLKTAGGTRTSSSLAPVGLGEYCQSTMDYSIEVSYKDWTNGGSSRTLFAPHNSGYVRVNAYARGGLDQIACNFNNGTYYYFGSGSKSVVEGSHTITMVKQGQTPYVYIDGVYVPAQSGGKIGTYEPGSSVSYFAWNNAATHDETYCRIAMYSRALTPAEIAANYDIDKSRFGLVG